MIDLMDPDGVTAEWLTEVFAAEGVLRSGSVVSCAAEPLAMSFTGVVPTLELSYDVDEPGLPRTLIAKFLTPDPEMRAAIHSMGFYGREAAFYRELGATTLVPVPVCYYAAIDENDGRCVILLQDLTTARRDGPSTPARRRRLSVPSRRSPRWMPAGGRTPTWSFGDGWIPTGSCRWRPPNPNLRPTLRRNGTGSIEPKTVTSLREIHTAFFN